MWRRGLGAGRALVVIGVLVGALSTWVAATPAAASNGYGPGVGTQSPTAHWGGAYVLTGVPGYAYCINPGTADPVELPTTHWAPIPYPGSAKYTNGQMAALMYFAEVYQGGGYPGYTPSQTDASIAEVAYTSAGGTTPPASRGPTGLVALIKSYMTTYAGPWTISLTMSPPSGSTFEVGSNYSATITVRSATGNGVGGLGFEAPATGGPSKNQISNFVWLAPTTNSAGQISFTWNISGVPPASSASFSAQTLLLVSPAPGAPGTAPPTYAAPGGTNGQTMVTSGVSEDLVTSFSGVAKATPTTQFGALKVQKGVNDGAYYGPGGAVFQVYSMLGALMDTITTGPTGAAQTATNLPSATAGTTYLVREATPPPGYGTQPAQTVTVYPKPVAPALATFSGANEDRVIPAHLGAEKIDSQTGAPLAGATFSFAYDQANNGIYNEDVGSCTTGSTGVCSPPTENTTGGWLAGIYQVTELAAPPGYWLDPATAIQTVTITPGATAVASVTFGDLLLGSLQLHKTGNDLAYWSVTGAVFTVTGPAPSTASLGTLTVGPTGSTGTLDGLEPGSYTLTETTVPAGYSAVTPVTVAVAVGHTTTTVTAADPVLPGTIRLTKTDAETHAPLPGAVFDVRYDATNDGTYSVDLGKCTTGPGGTCAPPPNDGGGYLPGRYEAIEVAAPPSYYLPTPRPVATFTLAPGGTETPVFSDHLLVPVSFIKVASGNVSSALVTLRGAVIEVAPGTTWGGAVLASCTTGSTGTCTTASVLISGSSYCWREVTAPPGLSSGTTGCFVADNAQGSQPITVTDPGMFTPVVVRKVDADTEDHTIPGATYDLYRVDTAVSVPAPLRPTNPAPATEPGQTWVGRATTNATGVATFGLEYPGYAYCVLELVAPANYDATHFEHCTPGPVAGSTASPPPVTIITVADMHSLVTLRAHKFAAASPTTVIPGATYDLYVVGDLPPGTVPPVAPSGPSPAPEPGHTWYARGTTNATGNLAWTLPAGYSWCLHEVTAPPQYALTTGLYCSPVLTVTTPLPVTTIALPETVALVTLHARKFNDTNPADVIAGATYEIVGQGTPPPGYRGAADPAGYPVPAGDWYYGAVTTNSSGLVSAAVPAGDSYCLHEVVVPTGYQQDLGWHCTAVLTRDPSPAATTIALPETPSRYTIVAGGGLPSRGGGIPLWPGAGWLLSGICLVAGVWLLGGGLHRRSGGRGGPGKVGKGPGPGGLGPHMTSGTPRRGLASGEGGPASGLGLAIATDGDHRAPAPNHSVWRAAIATGILVVLSLLAGSTLGAFGGHFGVSVSPAAGFHWLWCLFGGGLAGIGLWYLRRTSGPGGWRLLGPVPAVQARRRSNRIAATVAIAAIALVVAIIAGTLSLTAATTPVPIPAASVAPLPVRAFTMPAPPTSLPAPALALGPTQIVIPSLGVSAPVVSEGITRQKLDIPANVHVVGRWSGGGQPDGLAGTVLLAGHVDWVGQGDGAFYPLAEAQAGSAIYLSGPAGTVSAWVVVSAHAYLKENLPQTIFAAQGPRRLVLVTCGGAFDATTGHYVDNVVVTAAPASMPR